jgi:Zn-dependent M28 family amino/carboxypeptidase
MFKRSLAIVAAVSLALAGGFATAKPHRAPASLSGPIDPARLSATVKTLASDAFEGRAPGSPGEVKTVAYLIARFKALGLKPAGENGGWTQRVPLVHTQVLPASSASLSVGGQTLALTQAKEIYLKGVRPQDRIDIAKAPIVFVGYGVNAPERGWDDFKGVDLHGKVAVILVNDPDFEAAPGEPAAGRFGGRAMTYYGRWTYKYEEAGRRGALAAIIVHETPGAGYGWSTVIAPGGEDFDVVRPATGPGSLAEKVPLAAWMARDTAADLFRRAGLDFEALKRAARDPAFKPVEIPGAAFTADVRIAHTEVESLNVLAKLPGASRPKESVMYSAHWDAYGVAPTPGPKGEKVIRHGANDDGLGVAGVLEVARAFVRGPRPARTIVFGVWTAEERGLLGSEYWGAHPTVPLETMAANYTIDVLQTAGPAHDLVLIGAGQNSLETGLAKAAAAQGRTITPDAKPERGLFYRADHFSLAKRGVPVLLIMGIGGGADLIDGGRAAGDQWVSDYTAHCYHQACDAWSASWDLRGAAQDVAAIYEAGRAVANSRGWPTWNAGSEFRGVRERSAGRRG